MRLRLPRLLPNKGNGAKALEHLKKAGSWALDIATKIGTDIAAAALNRLARTQRDWWCHGRYRQ